MPLNTTIKQYVIIVKIKSLVVINKVLVSIVANDGAKRYDSIIQHTKH